MPVFRLQYCGLNCISFRGFRQRWCGGYAALFSLSLIGHSLHAVVEKEEESGSVYELSPQPAFSRLLQLAAAKS